MQGHILSFPFCRVCGILFTLLSTFVLSQATRDEKTYWTTLDTLDVINLESGDVLEFPLPGNSSGGCAVEYDGFLFLVRASSNGVESNQVYRTKGK